VQNVICASKFSDLLDTFANVEQPETDESAELFCYYFVTWFVAVNRIMFCQTTLCVQGSEKMYTCCRNASLMEVIRCMVDNNVSVYIRIQVKQAGRRLDWHSAKFQMLV